MRLIKPLWREFPHVSTPVARDRLPGDVKRLFLILTLLLTCVTAAAQERHNYLAVNGGLLDEAGPYYFIKQGDSSNAFARAQPLAEALKLTVSYVADEKVLVFSDGLRTARFKATSDIAAGLIKAPGTVTLSPPVGGQTTLASPLAILVDGVAYVAITPLVAAFEGVSSWNAERHIITIDTADRLGYTLARARTGLTDGVSRVAIDIPENADYQVAAGGKAFVIVLPGARSESYDVAVDDPNLSAVGVTAEAGRVTIGVHTKFDLEASGSGFRVGIVPKATGRTLYVDFAPSVRGNAVTALQPAPGAGQTEPAIQEALQVVPEHRQVVVIDAGHGGHDPGATGFAIEKQIVLSVAMKLKQLLEAEGVDVILTRGDDTFLTLQQRSLFATPERNVFVSIHANSAANASASGIETWVFGEPLNPSLIDRAIEENGGGTEGQALTEEARASARDLAADILREAQLNYSLTLAETVQRNLIDATGARDRGVRANLFYVIRTARIPAILVELGFVSNPEEGRDLATDSYQGKLAKALADGLLEFLHGGGLVARR